MALCQVEGFAPICGPKIVGLCRIFSPLFLLIPALLWADPPVVEPTGNTLSVESSSNTVTAQDTLTLPEVVVTANRLDTPASQVANSMTVLNAKEIEQKQAQTAQDALQGLPGLALLQNGAPGENSGLFIRGADSSHTLVLLDGIPLNNPMGIGREYGDWDQLFLDDVNRIEVVRGPLSTVYGTNATAGVVNLITQGQGGPPKASLLFEGGTYESFREAATASLGNGQGSLSVSRFDTQGFPSADKSLGNNLNDPDDNTTASLRLGMFPAPNLNGDAFLRYTQSRTNLPALGGPEGDDPKYFLNERQWVAGDQMKWSLVGGAWEQVLGLSYTDDLQLFTDDFSSYLNTHYERGAFEGQSAQVNWQNNVKPFEGETLVVGVQGRQEWGREDDTTDYGYGLSDTFINQIDTTGSYFVESQTALDSRFFATLGCRLDAVSSFGSPFTYRAAAAYFIPGLETKLKASYGTGFKAPSLYQLYSPYGNTTLQAETSEGWDMGFEQPFAKETVKAGATYFHNAFSNLIDFEATSAPPYGQYYNVGQALTEGWETFVTAKPLKSLELKADYTYTWAVDLDTGDQLIRRPQNQADFSASYQWGAANLGLNILYVGDRPDMAFLNYTSTPVTLPAYALVNLLGSFQVDEHLKFFGRVDNLFNTVYEEVYGYGTPGLSIYMGTKVSI